MLASIRKFSKSIFAKIFIAIIALPFVMWGMGDVFRSGKQNILVEINDEKISSKEFVSFVQNISLSKKEFENIGKDKILNDILTNFISEKIIDLERQKKGLRLSDAAIKTILVNDKAFLKDEKFSRVKYEKFLLTNGYSAVTYEENLKNVELKGQLLNYYSGGIRLPNFIIEDLYKKENLIKEIEYLNLDEIYNKKIISDKEIKDFYEKNKKFFEEKFKSFKYLELTPKILTKKDVFDEEYYEKIDKLENQILDGDEFEVITSGHQKNVKIIKLVNFRKTREDGTVVKNIDSQLFKKIFNIKEINSPQFININNKYYVSQITEEKNITLNLNDKNLRKTIYTQLMIGLKIEENRNLINKINDGNFNKNSMLDLSKKNNILIKKIKLNGINDTKKFNVQLLNKIYNHNDKEIFLISDSLLQNNFLIQIINEQKPIIDRTSDEYKKYLKKANIEYISKVYKSYDKYINTNYTIDINQKVFERLKNSF